VAFAGFKKVNTACCGIGNKYRGLITCQPFFNICDDRNAFFFWDPYHPTEAVNRILTRRLLYGPPSDISPINLSSIVF
jgi:phospholipase/lecithinase/hemolysin